MSAFGHPIAESGQQHRVRAAVASVSLLLCAGIASALSSSFIATGFADRPTPRDLLFETLPYVDAAQYTADIAVYTALVLLGIDLFRNRPRDVPGALSIFGLMYLLRAIFMTLTPLASAHGNGAPYGILPIVQNGMWPSGHAAAALLCVLLLDKSSAALRCVQIGLAVVVIASLILGRAHYSIDVVGGLLLAYFVQREWSRGSLFDPMRRLIQPD